MSNHLPTAALLLLIPLASFSSAQSDLPHFTDVTTAAGIRFEHSTGDPELSNIVEGTGPGAMFFDYDSDGDLDIYFACGCWQRGVSDNRGRHLRGKLANALYRNEGDGTFSDVTAAAGVGDKGYGMGASCADYDGDGDLDLYVLNYGANVLYRNEGDGTFSDVTAKAGLDDPMWSLNAPWLDYDSDGDLDVFVANYLQYDQGKFRDFYPASGYPGPLAYSGQPDHLYRNNGDGTFTDVTRAAGLFHPRGRAMSAVAVDLDMDGDSDIFVTNDAMPNNYWVNDGKGHFEDKALVCGLAFGEGGQGASSMGPAVGDVDRNGLYDVFVPDMGYGCMLFQESASAFFDVTAQTGLTLICGQYTGWGGLLIDYDNNGYLDVFVANGNPHHLHSEEDVLARWDGKGRFIDVSADSGPYFHAKYVGRGAAYGDYDNDGDIDILVANLADRPRLLRNDGGSRRSWIKIVPRLKKGGPVAIGARVSVLSGGLRQIQPVIAVNGYLASNDPRPNFGLGSASKVALVEITWPGGQVQQLKDIPANQILEVVRRDE